MLFMHNALTYRISLLMEKDKSFHLINTCQEALKGKIQEHVSKFFFVTQNGRRSRYDIYQEAPFTHFV